MWERRPLLCVPVPGLSAWTRPSQLKASSAQLASQATAEGAQNRKRERSDADDADADMMEQDQEAAQQSADDCANPSAKRAVGSGAEGAGEQHAHAHECCKHGTCSAHSQQEAAPSAAPAAPVYLPGSCLVYVSNLLGCAVAVCADQCMHAS